MPAIVKRRRGIGVLLGLLMCVNTACYSFVPVATAVAPKAGDQVRVRLNADGQAGMASVLGPAVEYAEGTLVSIGNDGSIVVGVGSIRLTEGVDRFWSGQNVATFPSRFVAGVDVRALNHSKTRAAAIGSGLAVLAIFALSLAAKGVSGQPGGGGTQPPP
jgi:hypothetical protein